MHQHQTTTCRNPFTGEILGMVSQHEISDVRLAVQRARWAQERWAATPLATRVRCIEGVRDFVATHADELAETVARSTGKTRTEAMATEIVPSTIAATYYAKNTARFLKEQRVKSSHLLFANKATRVQRVPWGVIGVVSPDNYPFAIPFSKIVMGLLAGNAVVVQMAHHALMVSRALKVCFSAQYLPPDATAFLNLPESDGRWLLESGVDKLFYTGSARNGKEVMAEAARALIPVSMELSGNDAMLVCPDADLDSAAAGAVWAGMQNCGQTHSGVKRIYVHKDVYQTFINYLGERVRVLRVGYDNEHDVDIGAPLDPAVIDNVRGKVGDALEKGAVIWSESESPEFEDGHFMRATVLIDADHSMRIMREETFGPVVAVMKVEDMEHAVALANDSEMGLTASVWSKNHGRAREIARGIQAGVVMINDHLLSHGMPEVSWGGVKTSGIGRAHGEIGFSEMTQPRCIIDDRLPGVKKDMWWSPNDATIYDGLHGIIDMCYSHNIGRRLSGLGRVMRILPRTYQS